MGWRLTLGLLAVALGCGDDDGPTAERQPSPGVEQEPEPEPEEREPEPEPAAMVVLVREKALELRSTASPNEGEPWAAEREPAGDSLVLVGATADHVLLQKVELGGDGSMPFIAVPRGGAAAEPVTASRAHVAPDGEHWVLERAYQRFRCGGMARGRNAFVRTFGSEDERAIGEGFLGFGPESTAVLSISVADCGPAGGLRNQGTYVRWALLDPADAPPLLPRQGGAVIGDGPQDEPGTRLAFHPAPWIDAEPVPVEVTGSFFGTGCFLTLGDERTQLMGPACRQPESVAFAGDGSHYAFVIHEHAQAVLTIVERASGEVRTVPLGRAGDVGAMPGICGGPRGERWLVTRPDAVVVAVVGSEVSELERGLCIGAAPGGHTWALGFGERVELRAAADPTEPGTVLEGVTALRWLPPSE